MCNWVIIRRGRPACLPWANTQVRPYNHVVLVNFHHYFSPQTESLRLIGSFTGTIERREHGCGGTASCQDISSTRESYRNKPYSTPQKFVKCRSNVLVRPITRKRQTYRKVGTESHESAIVDSRVAWNRSPGFFYIYIS